MKTGLPNPGSCQWGLAGVRKSCLPNPGLCQPSLSTPGIWKPVY